MAMTVTNARLRGSPAAPGQTPANTPQGPYLQPGGAVPPGLRSPAGPTQPSLPGIYYPPLPPIQNGATSGAISGSTTIRFNAGVGRGNPITAQANISARGYVLPGISSEPTMVDGS